MNKLKAGPFGDFKIISNKNQKLRILSSITVPKHVKGGTLWDFLTSILLQNIETIEGEPFGAIQNFQIFKKLIVTQKNLK